MGELTRIAVVGAGAIGCYYGARLARVGEDVHFLMRSDLEAVRTNGLSLKTPSESWTLRPVQSYGSAAEIGVCDLVIVALKATAHGALRSLIAPLLHERTAILTLENGLGSDELLAGEFGAERVIGGLCFIAVNRTAPGQIWCIHPGSLSLAEYNRPRSSRVTGLAERFSKAGVKCAVSDNLAELRWRKLVWNIPFNGLSIAAGGVTTDRILGDLQLEPRVRELMSEVIQAATRLGYRMPENFIEHQIEITRPMGPYKPSSLIDYLAGREVEVEAIWGEPLRRAQKAGVEMPQLEDLYQMLKRLTLKSS